MGKGSSRNWIVARRLSKPSAPGADAGASVYVHGLRLQPHACTDAKSGVVGGQFADHVDRPDQVVDRRMKLFEGFGLLEDLKVVEEPLSTCSERRAWDSTLMRVAVSVWEDREGRSLDRILVRPEDATEVFEFAPRARAVALYVVINGNVECCQVDHAEPSLRRSAGAQQSPAWILA
jgi:hypothetical protein